MQGIIGKELNYQIMLFISTEDFFEKAKHVTALTRQEEMEVARKMQAGDKASREKLIQSYMPYLAVSIKHQRIEFQTLELVLRCYVALEKAVDSFDFLQNSEPFSHRLSLWLRQTIIRYIVDKRS